MTSPSPSEFLTFMRHMSTRQTLLRSRIPQRSFLQARSLHASPRWQAINSERDHATEKKDELDVQSSAVEKGKATKNKQGDNAAGEFDSQNATAKARKDHPEAPDVIIGMQDERGGRGA